MQRKEIGQLAARVSFPLFLTNKTYLERVKLQGLIQCANGKTWDKPGERPQYQPFTMS